MISKGAAWVLLFFQFSMAFLFGQSSFRNVVVLIGDDHAAGVLGCYGNSLARTPKLDEKLTYFCEPPDTDADLEAR